MKKLLLELNRFHPVSAELEKFIRDKAISKTFRKGEVILKEGQICRYVYFIEAGLVRHEAVKDEKVYTPWILKEGNFVTSADSFFYQVPAKESIIMIEETEVIYLSFEDLEKGCRLHPELARIREKVKEKYYALNAERDRRLGLLAMDERYQHLLETEPELIGRVTVEILSSYLQMSSKTLYKIRSELYRAGLTR